MDAASIRQEIGDIERKLVSFRDAACRQQDRLEAGEKVDEEALAYIKGEIERLSERQEELIASLRDSPMMGSLDMSPTLKSSAFNDYGVFIFVLGVIFLIASMYGLNRFKSHQRSKNQGVSQQQLQDMMRAQMERNRARAQMERGRAEAGRRF